MAIMKKAIDCYIRVDNEIYPPVDYSKYGAPRGEPQTFKSINLAKKHSRVLMKEGHQIRKDF